MWKVLPKGHDLSIPTSSSFKLKEVLETTRKAETNEAVLRPD